MDFDTPVTPSTDELVEGAEAPGSPDQMRKAMTTLAASALRVHAEECPQETHEAESCRATVRVDLVQALRVMGMIERRDTPTLDPGQV